LHNLGLIILDEEHDLSFKQQEGFRYHARDVALYRAHLENCPIILGSATPSMESYALADQGKLTRLELNERAGTALLPKLHILDLKVGRKQHGFSQFLLDEMHKRLARKEQVLIFLNRRGYAPVILNLISICIVIIVAPFIACQIIARNVIILNLNRLVWGLPKLKKV